MKINEGSICYAKSLNYNTYNIIVILRLCEYSKEYNDLFIGIYNSIQSEFGNFNFSEQPKETLDSNKNSETDVSTDTSLLQTTPSSEITSEHKNALNKAKQYLEVSAFSYLELIEQLKYDKFTDEQATSSADNCNADWNEQASKKAESYLSFSSFSRS